jgi:predicted RNA methylase
MKKKQLISIIEQLRTFDKPKVKLEQYPTNAGAAVELAFIAGFMHDDIYEKTIIDLGIGTGRLAITLLFVGAAKAIGIEIDDDAIKLSMDNAKQFGFSNKLNLVKSNVDNISRILHCKSHPSIQDEEYTLVMNPPFGVQNRGADVKFLLNAMKIEGLTVIYSFHLKNQENRKFLRNKIASAGWEVSEIHQMNMILPKLFDFHEKNRKKIEVDLYRIVYKKKN